MSKCLKNHALWCVGTLSIQKSHTQGLFDIELLKRKIKDHRRFLTIRKPNNLKTLDPAFNHGNIGHRKNKQL